MNKTIVAVIGGFLGSGKTTSILEIAKYLTRAGKKVGIVTNDQGNELVDTNFLARSGLPVLEVTGGCFCCNFEEFTEKIDKLSDNLKPDIILAEPVGSCTDLVAAIFKPVKVKLANKFKMAPLSVIADPKRVKKFMMDKDSLFPSEINYLFEKQLEEADVIVLNKIDTLDTEKADSIISFLKHRFKGAEVIKTSALKGLEIEKWVSLISNNIAQSKSSIEVDYKIYADAEQYLGWFNSSSLLTSSIPYDSNLFIMDFMEGVKEGLKVKNHEIAHLKIYEISGDDFAKASITGISDEAGFDKSMNTPVTTSTFIINARAGVPPEILEPIIMDALVKTGVKYNVSISDMALQCFKPSKPVPIYRIE